MVLQEVEGKSLSLFLRCQKWHLDKRNTPNPSYSKRGFSLLAACILQGQKFLSIPSSFFLFIRCYVVPVPCRFCCLFYLSCKRIQSGKVLDWYATPFPEVNGLSRHKCPSDTYSTFH